MKYTFIILAFLAVIAVGCKKKGEPYPRICTDKNDYRIVDTIRLENCSERYTKQRWVMPDGSQSTAAYVYFVPPTAATSYTFRLYVTDEDFVQEYEAVKTIYVNP
jgi:hypothetical protein